MIIDLILDRRDGKEYNPKTFYNDVMQYGEIGFKIASALDSGGDEDIKRELCQYIKEQNYNIDICHYIKSVNWL